MGEVGTKQSYRARARRGAWLGAATLTLAVLVVACGSSGQPQQSATSSTSESAASSGSIVATSLPAGTTTTLQGTVTEGVESGCVVLVDSSGAVSANLQGWDLRAHPFDSQVEVTGAFEPDMMTTCQQGTPFEVTTVVSR